MEQISRKMANKCYECVHRGMVPGSCHSSCRHPAFEEAHGDSTRKMLSIFASVGRCSPVSVTSDKIKVVGRPYGIAQGWFQHPYNFDPVWLVECEGFKQKEK